ncbi:MAG: hypothetical protein ACK4RV_13675 [Caulobacter sp.]
MNRLQLAREAEKKNFYAMINSGDVAEQCRDDSDLFESIVSLAINDYGVGRRDLAFILGVSEAAISRWSRGMAMPPRHSRPNIVGLIAAVLARTLVDPDSEVVELPLDNARASSAN